MESWASEIKWLIKTTQARSREIKNEYICVCDIHTYMYIWIILKWNDSKRFLDFCPPQIMLRFKTYFGWIKKKKKWESQLVGKYITKLALAVYPSGRIKKKHHQSSGIWRSVSSHSKSETLRAKNSCCPTSSQQVPGKVNNEIQLLTMISSCKIFIYISL